MRPYVEKHMTCANSLDLIKAVSSVLGIAKIDFMTKLSTKVSGDCAPFPFPNRPPSF